MASNLECISCGLDFAESADRFIEHMETTHNDDNVQCTTCLEQFASGSMYAMHFIDSHLGVTESTSSESAASEPKLTCPICTFRAFDERSIDEHFDDVHSLCGQSDIDISIVNDCQRFVCPMCKISCDTSDGINAHVNSHFEDNDNSNSCRDSKLEVKQKRQHLAEAASSRCLQEQYGMPHIESASTGRALHPMNSNRMNGQETRSSEIWRPEHVSATENITWGVSSFLDRLKTLIAASNGTQEVHLCSSVIFFATDKRDQGFGCGFRNSQMILSSLMACPRYRQRFWTDEQNVAMPSVYGLQRMIENAWAAGFDSVGANQLARKLVNTRKWIGATELAALLCSRRIRCEIVDFHRATGADNSHPLLFKWCWEYFTQSDDFIPPLYIQHQGHSRTVIGIEKTRVQSLRLLILDPSFDRLRVGAICSGQDDSAVAFLRRPLGHMKRPQFQLMAVRGLISSEAEYQRSKHFHHNLSRLPAL